MIGVRWSLEVYEIMNEIPKKAKDAFSYPTIDLDMLCKKNGLRFKCHFN